MLPGLVPLSSPQSIVAVKSLAEALGSWVVNVANVKA